MDNIEESNQEDLKELEVEETTKNDEESEEETVEELKERLAKAEEEKNNQKIRAEKAEKLNKKVVKPKVEKETPKNENLTFADQRALIKADIHEDDLEEITEYADFKKISVREALKTTAVKSIIAESAETRNVADATNTKKARRGKGEVSADRLLNDFKDKGTMPESDEDLDKMLDAKYS